MIKWVEDEWKHQILKQEKRKATKKKGIYVRRMRCNKNSNKRGFYTDYKKRFVFF